MKSLLFASFVIFITLTSLNVNAQDWLTKTGDDKVNFYDIQKKFSDFWKDKNITRTTPKNKRVGWKQFKRWEWFWAQRVFPSGKFPAPNQLVTEKNKWLKSKKNKNKLQSVNSWTNLGPSSSNGGYAGLGRINWVQEDPGYNGSTNKTIWIGSPSGGLWKSTDDGNNWTSMLDEFNSIGVSSIIINPDNSNIIYIATGDGEVGDTYSIGVLKSTNGGSSWSTTGLDWSTSNGKTIRKIVIHKSDRNILYAATSNGIYKTTNAGSSWSQVKSGTYLDIEFKPNCSDTLFASGYYEIVRTTDAGANWATLSTGLPTSNFYRIELAVTPKDSNYIYALYGYYNFSGGNSDNNFGYYGVYRSTDGGNNWTEQSKWGNSGVPNILGWDYDGSGLSGQAFYDLVLAVSPFNKDSVYVGGVNIWRSVNGASNWSCVAHWWGDRTNEVHADHHFLGFSGNTSRLYDGCDGGIYRSTNGGNSWSWLGSGLKITQFYRLGCSKTSSGKIIAGAQDNGTKYYNSSAWSDIIGGDGMECIISHSNANVMYGSYPQGSLTKSTDGGSNFYDMAVSSTESGDWVTPYVMDPNNSSNLYVGYMNVWKSTNGGTSFSKISNFSSGTFTVLHVAPSNTNYIYAGYDNTLKRTTDGGSSWSSVTLPASTTLTYMAIHNTDPNIIWAVFSGYSSGNKVYKSTNGGSSWTNLTGNNFPNVPVNTIVFQRNLYNRIYVGTDIGVFYIDDTKSDWQDFNGNLPNVKISELEIHEGSNKLRAASYGRGLWESEIDPSVPAPTITSFTPTSGITGTVVTITGTNFTGTTSVKFGGTVASSYTINSSTEIAATVGSGTTGTISVTTEGGTATSTGTFTYNAIPVITSFTPSSGGSGASVTITGTNFTGATSVKFGGTNATSYTVNSSTQITATVASGSTGTISVSNSNGTGASSGTFTFIPTPTISSFSPITGGSGTAVTITGTNLSDASSVKFGGTNATSYIVNSSTQITAIVGSGATGQLSVVTPGGTGTSSGTFTYIPAPTISSFTPITGGSGTSVTISGTNLSDASNVKFGGTNAASYIANSSTQITAIVGNGATGQISVVTPGGTGTSSGTFTFIPAPTISSFTPITGGSGTSVTISGTNLSDASSVKFGGNNAASYIVNSSTQITAVVGSGATGQISVVTPGGTGTSSGNFTFIPAPTISSFTPITGGSGTSVTISGTNLSGASSVKFGENNAANFTVNSSTQITAIVGNGATGQISVVTPGGTGTSSGTFTYVPAPTISSFTPITGAAGTSVTLTGTNFTDASSVKFGGTNAASFIVNSSTQITAIVGSGATGQISVVTPGGSANSSGTFTYVPTPTISSFTPITGGSGTSVTITGTNFTDASSVKFSGTNATNFTVNSSTQITAIVGNGATGQISVVTPGGSANSSGTFTFIPAPTISSFTPITGGSGTSVVISGTNLSNATSVKFGGTNASSFTVNSSTQITAIVGSGSTGQISVVTPGGSANSSGSFTFIPAPTISSFTPITGGSGTSVIITGTNFSDASSVKFGSTNAVNFTVNSSTQITAIVGNGSTGQISVVTPGGTGTSSSNFIFIPTPSISSFTPITGGAGTSVTISGTNFSNATNVKFGTTNATSFSVISSTQITAFVGNGSTGQISVVTPGGSAISSGTFTFIPAPTISSFTPITGGAGTSVTITGTNFNDASSVKFGGTNAASFNVNSSTQIIAIVGSGTTGQISVSTPGGTVTSSDIFTFIPAPTISSFTPITGGSGTSITITGANFNDASSVKFGGTNAVSFTVNSSSKITAVVGSGSSGQISVVTPGGTSTSSGTFTFIPAPTISSFNPASGGSGTSVIIIGANFTDVTNIKFGVTNASSYTVNSASQITAVVGSGSTGQITVTSANGTGTSSGIFTFIPAPTISSFTPSSGGSGATVTISGTNFSDATNVKFGETSAASYTVNSSTQITAVVSNGSTGQIGVITPGGSGTSSGTFTFIPVPTISSFTPTSGGSGTSVTITGTDFTASSSIKFGGIDASSVTVNSSTQITAIVGSGTTGTIKITTEGGSSNSTQEFSFIKAPTILSFSPTSGSSGKVVSIFGTNLSGASSVKFGGTDASNFTIKSANQINATVGNGSTGSISITTPGGTAVSSNIFTYIPAPGISSFTSVSCSSGTTVTITGTDFTNITSVKFGNTEAASFTVNSTTEITAIVGSGSSGNISVTNAIGTGTSTDNFTFILPPTISSFTPSNGIAGTIVTITGTNFSTATNVKFGGINVTSFTVSSSTELLATVGNGATGLITVTTTGGTAESSDIFTFIKAPIISSFTPGSGVSGTLVTITGSYFTGTSSVKFGGINAANFVIKSSTEIEATLSSGTTGKISITNPEGTGTSSTNFIFLELPTIISGSVTNITNSKVNSGGDVTNDGGATVTSKGVCWSLKPNPTINDSKTSDGSGSGSFTSIITGLQSNTNYYLRAYATKYNWYKLWKPNSI